MSSSEGFGGGPYEHLLGQGASGFTPDNLNMHSFHQESENGLSKKKRNKNRSSTASNASLTSPAGSKTVDKSSGFLPKNGRKSNGQVHNNNNHHQTRHSSQSEYELLCEKEDLDNRTLPELNGNFNGVHSPRGAAVPLSWNGKQDNTKAVPDPSSIVERLMHLRDCIKQVTSIMHSLEKADEPVTGKQMGNLNQMLQMLRSEEQENMELLQQVLACREETERTKMPVVAQRELSPLQISTSTNRRRNNQPVQPESNEVEHDDPQNDLLLRMLDSQKKFATIREQQASLLRLQKQAEEKLAVARAFHEQFVQSSFASEGAARSVSSNLSSSSASSSSSSGVDRGVSRSNPLLIQEQEGCEDDTSETALVVPDHMDDIDEDLLAGFRPPVVPPRKEERSSFSSPSFDLEEIQKRLCALKELQIERQAQCEQLEEGGMMASPRSILSSDVISREQAQQVSERQRQHLEGKVRQLQEKKQQMNTLLAELSNLQSSAQLSEDQRDLPSVSPASFPSPANSSIHDAAVVSDIGEAQRKLKQLEEMKTTLRTLQRLTENIEQVDNSLNKEDAISLPPPPPTRSLSQSCSDSVRSIASVKPDNLRRDCVVSTSAQFPARRHYEAEGRANEDADALQNMAAAVAVNQNPIVLTSLGTSSNGSVSNGNGSSRSGSVAGDSRSIDLKVKELANAENKLKQLKLLLSSMHSSAQDGEEQPFSAGLLASLPPALQVGGANAIAPVANNGDLGEESEDSGVSADQTKAGQEEFEIVLETGKSKRQLKRDLELLLRERSRLATMQQQLSNLQLQYRSAPPAMPAPSSAASDGLNNSRDRSSGEGGSLLRARAGAQLSHSFTSNETGRQDNLHRGNKAPRSEAKTLNSQANNAQQGGKSRSRVRAASVEYAAASPNHINHNNNNSSEQNSGFSDLSDQLNYNLALRDELRAQKAVLQELLNQERSKQMGFSHNQDTQSQSESSGKTEKSEVASMQCPSTTAPSLDQHELTTIGQWGLFGNSMLDDGPSFSASDNLQGFDDQQQSGVSSPWQKNFPSTSPAQEEMLPFQQMAAHTNFPRGVAPRLAQPLPPPPIAHQLQQQHQQHLQLQQQLQQPPQHQQWDQLSRHFQKQAESTHALCQTVLREQQAMILMAANAGSGSSSTGSSNGIGPNGGAPVELLSSYIHQLQQQQQLLFSLSHCFHLLCLQQLQVTQIHAAWAMQGNVVPSRPDACPSPYAFQAIGDPLPSASYGFGPSWPPVSVTSKTPPMPQQMPFFPPPSTGVQIPFSYPPPVSNATSQMAYNVISGDDNASVSSGNSMAGRGVPETLNNQMPPRTRANNFLDNFRSNSRQNLLSSKCNDPQHHQKAKPCPPTATPPGGPGCQLRSSSTFSGSTGEESGIDLSQASLNRQNISLDSVSHFGGVRPRTKKPNMSQEKVNYLNHGPTNVTTVLPAAQPSHQIDATKNPAMFPTVSGLYTFSKPLPEMTQTREVLQPQQQLPAKPLLPPSTGNSGGAPCLQQDFSLTESIYTEVGSLLNQWEGQPTVLRDLLQQIRTFQGGPFNQPQTVPPLALTAHQRCNLMDFTNAAANKSEESAVSPGNPKLSKQSAAFGSKRMNPHNVPCPQDFSLLPSNISAPGSSSQRVATMCINGQHKNQDAGHPMHIPQRQGTNGMESIPESYTMATVKSEKPDIVSHLRGVSNDMAASSEESCSFASNVSSAPNSSSSNHNNTNCKGQPGGSFVSLSQQCEDYRAAPDGGAALPPTPPLPQATTATVTHLPPTQLPPGNGAKYPEDCGSYHYDAEGETEAETEDDDTKDLAEADQSAGQINSGHGILDVVLSMTQDGSIRSGSSSLSLPAAGTGAGEGAEGGEELATLSTEIVSSTPCCSCPLVATNGGLESLSCEHSCLSSSAQASAPDLDVDELALDDVPIKLETLSAEELRHQMLDEQAANCLLGEMLMDPHGTQLAPDNDTRPGAF